MQSADFVNPQVDSAANPSGEGRGGCKFGRVGECHVILAHPVDVRIASGTKIAAYIELGFKNVRFTLLVGTACGIPMKMPTDIQNGIPYMGKQD
ncbi:hypothetical protein APSETT444_001571 [Aspergillus pseudonomiae]